MIYLDYEYDYGLDIKIRIGNTTVKLENLRKGDLKEIRFDLKEAINSINDALNTYFPKK